MRGLWTRQTDDRRVVTLQDERDEILRPGVVIAAKAVFRVEWLPTLTVIIHKSRLDAADAQIVAISCGFGDAGDNLNFEVEARKPVDAHGGPVGIGRRADDF